MTPTELVLQKLEAHKLKRTGAGAWVACCPHHEDRTPSLSIREGSDGRVLLHCHGGCSIDSVVGSMGLSLTDLFPQGEQSAPRRHRALTHGQALAIIKFETLLVATAASNLAAGHTLKPEDLDRLLVAAARIEKAMQEAGV